MASRGFKSVHRKKRQLKMNHFLREVQTSVPDTHVGFDRSVSFKPTLSNTNPISNEASYRDVTVTGWKRQKRELELCEYEEPNVLAFRSRSDYEQREDEAVKCVESCSYNGNTAIRLLEDESTNSKKVNRIQKCVIKFGEGEDSRGEQAMRTLKWQQLRKNSMNVDYATLYSTAEADSLLQRCENELQYFVGDLAKVRVFGKWHDIPRKQVAHGDPGLTYSFSGTTVCAMPWTPLLKEIQGKISTVTGHSFNFVLINRYNDGQDYMGEHKDDEKDLFPGHPIASLSLGQSRDFVFRHQDTRKKAGNIPNVTVPLRHGMLLMMNHPTNTYWYHSLPKRARAMGVRINMTFRKMDPAKCKPMDCKCTPMLTR